MKKSLFLFVALIVTSSGFTQSSIRNFEELMTSLKAGKSVKTVIYYGRCKLFSGGAEEAESPNAIGGMKIDTYEYFDSSVFHGKVPSFLSTSQTVLINHPSYGYVYNYVKMKIRSDSSVEITARYLKQRNMTKKYKIVMDETFKGMINDGSNDGAVSLFSE